MSGNAQSAVKKILCGVDGSEEACRAAELASCLSRDLQAGMTFISVARAVEMTPELKKYVEAEGLQGQSFPILAADAEACLLRAEEIAAQCAAPTVARAVEVGDPFERMSTFARDKKIDLVVLGHHVRSSLSRLAQKPLAQRLADALPVNVLLVP